jgi:hypothetical protein
VRHEDTPEQQLIEHWEGNVDFLEETSRSQRSVIYARHSKGLQINQVIAMGVKGTLNGFQIAGSDLSTLFLPLTTFRDSAEKNWALDTTWNT